MIIQSDSIQAQLAEKAQSYAQDRSRHLLCPRCRVRTKLYTLKDGRRKCSSCGAKFNPDKKTDVLHVKQCADILLCFCINFTAQQAATLSGYRYRLVAALYDDFRSLLARQTLDASAMERLGDVSAYDRSVHEGKDDAVPVFGVKISAEGHVLIEPLYAAPATSDRNREYAGFIRCGKFHRFPGRERVNDGAEQLWAWMSERLRRHHGIRRTNAGLYLKELEWKYNHRHLTSEAQAREIARLIPEDFLVTWSDKKNAPA